MPKVTVNQHFIGQPDEHAKYGGQIPSDHKKLEKRMSDAEKNQWSNLITKGTVIDVSEKRARELAGVGIVDFAEKAEATKTPEKVLVNTTNEKKSNAGPGK